MKLLNRYSKYRSAKGYFIAYNPNLNYKTKLGLFSQYFKMIELLKNIGNYSDISQLLEDKIDKNNLYESIEILNFSDSQNNQKSIFNDCIYADLESTRGNFDKINEILTIEEFKELVFFYWENIFKSIFISIFKNIKKQVNIKLSSINFKKMSVSDGLGYGGLIHKLELSISAISGVYYYGVSNYINGLSINEREILFLQSFLIIIDNNIDLYINVLNKITGLKDIKFEELGTHLLFLYTCYYDFLSPTDESLTFMDKYIDVKSFVNEETIKLNYYDFIDNVILKAKDIHNCKE